ncbi:hypothetical protein DICVIV_12167 [Dictyocaulus viviparus]|uniref:Dynactin subunit 4 n=1 Tax=Dictyocaulus viviparus TaxID=29172 RepID=A0A0D8XDJ6_DICVI|nr:hypothetical protein DICVIV_12167 [Dictyocaulus viviparus]
MYYRRSYNLGSVLTDRYGLQSIYQKRKKTFEKFVPSTPLHVATDEYFARNFVPEIRLSREPEIREGEIVSVLLTVANESNSKAEVVLMADNDCGIVQCITPTVELSLPSSDETADICDIENHKDAAHEGPGTVVFRRRHRAGIRMEVKCEAGSNSKSVLFLLVKYKNEQCFMHLSDEPEWKSVRVQIALTPCSQVICSY